MELRSAQLVLGGQEAVSTVFARGHAGATGTAHGVYVHRGAVTGGRSAGGVCERVALRHAGGPPGHRDNPFILWQHIATPPQPQLPSAAGESAARVHSENTVRAVSWCSCGPRQLWLAFVVGECAHLYAPSVHHDPLQVKWNHVHSFWLHHYKSDSGLGGRGERRNPENRVICATLSPTRCSIGWCPSGRRLLVGAGAFFMCDLSSVRRQYSHIGPGGVVSWSFNAPKIIGACGQDAGFSPDGGSLFFTFCERSRFLRVWAQSHSYAGTKEGLEE